MQKNSRCRSSLRRLNPIPVRTEGRLKKMKPGCKDYKKIILNKFKMLLIISCTLTQKTEKGKLIFLDFIPLYFVYCYFPVVNMKI